MKSYEFYLVLFACFDFSILLSRVNYSDTPFQRFMIRLHLKSFNFVQLDLKTQVFVAKKAVQLRSNAINGDCQISNLPSYFKIEKLLENYRDIPSIFHDFHIHPKTFKKLHLASRIAISIAAYGMKPFILTIPCHFSALHFNANKALMTIFEIFVRDLA